MIKTLVCFSLCVLSSLFAIVGHAECNPLVAVNANQQSRFDLLKQLADEHQFEISMLKTDDKQISLEKTLPLTKAIESITRDMSVVLSYQKIEGCERIVAISALDEDGWSDSASSSRWGSAERNEKLQRYIPKFEPVRVVQDEDAPELSYEQQQENEARAQERRERRGMRRLNDELEGGHQLRNNFNVRGDGWKSNLRSGQGEADISDMEQYTREVMNGERAADIRSMSVQQRSEYMKIRRQLRDENRDAQESDD